MGRVLTTSDGHENHARARMIEAAMVDAKNRTHNKIGNLERNLRSHVTPDGGA